MKMVHFVVLIGISTSICCAHIVPSTTLPYWTGSGPKPSTLKSYFLNEEITKPVGAPFITVTHGVQKMIYRMALDVPEYLTPEIYIPDPIHFEMSDGVTWVIGGNAFKNRLTRDYEKARNKSWEWELA